MIWALVTSVKPIIPLYIFPSPQSLLNSFITLSKNGILFSSIMSTLTRTILGVLVASIIAIPLGIIMGWFESVDHMFKYIIGILRPIPPIAWIPFAILWLGVGFTSQIFIIVIGCIFPILINTYDGVKRTEQILIESAQTLGASQRDILTKVILPSALPHIVTGLKVGMGIALMCTVAAEMVGADTGLGKLIMTSASLTNVSDAMVGMICIGLMGIIFDYLFSQFEEYIYW